MSDLEDAIRRSDLIFNGRVAELGASNLEGLDAAPHTAIVEVESVTHSPPALRGLAGQQVTVALEDHESVSAGEQYTFYTTALMFGENLAVQEVARDRVQAAAALADTVAISLASVEREALRERVAAAELVVAGRVSNVRPSPALAAIAATESPVGPISEHEPQWHEAVIDVQEVVKGSQAPAPTIILFPASIDIMWVDAPKFAVGQEGVWLLHGEHVPALAAEQFPTVFTALDKRDVLPRDRVQHVAQLMQDAP